MSIIRHTNFDKKVNTIADRNAIARKINHMTVLVNDAIADINAGAGKATYRWDMDDNSWILISKSGNEAVSFITEELLITDREVTLSNYPMNNAIWNAVIINNGIIQGDLNLNTATIAGGKIINIDPAFNGQILRLTYAHGSMVAQLNSVIEEKVDKTNVQALHATDALRNVGSVISLYKGDGTFESITVPDTLYTHPNSGVTAGTYRSVTVNTQGHITGGTNPTTLAGYGITDTYSKTETDTAINTALSFIDCGSIV